MNEDVELVKTGIEAVTSETLKPVRELISSIFGPAAEEAGLMLKDHVRVFRAKRLLRLYERTAEIFAKKGSKPQQVPLKLLFPIIENASIEESDELQDRWANLLARAADPKESDMLSLSYPAILRELSPENVKFLDALYGRAQEKAKVEKKWIGNITLHGWELLSVLADIGMARRPVLVTASDSMSGEAIGDFAEISLNMDMFTR